MMNLHGRASLMSQFVGHIGTEARTNLRGAEGPV
jgi:hypothetical protein